MSRNTFSRTLQPEEMERLFENEQLSEFYLRENKHFVQQDIERHINLRGFWKHILGMEDITAKIDSEFIQSVLFFGSVTNKAASNGLQKISIVVREFLELQNS